MSISSSLPEDDERTRIFGGAAPAVGVPDDATVIRPVAGLFEPGAAGAPPSSAANAEAHDASLLPIGTRVGEFAITRVVGQGGFGVVYEAWDHTLERAVAIKEYLPSSLSTRQTDGGVVPLSERHRETFDLGMRSFINEARLLAQFDHPSLLKVYRFWQERGTTYMVMPFYRGTTLRDALAERSAAADSVDEQWLLAIMDGVTQALAVMHAAQCFHRDIAPDNILLLEGSGRPVVLDFGAARRVITDKTQAMTVILKPGYAPIEQYAEMPGMSQGPWTDVYALAAVMHVAVTGRSPPPSIARMMSDGYQPLAGDALLKERYGARLLTAIDAGLAVKPEGRPQGMAELRAALGLAAAPLDDGATVQLPSPNRPASGPGTASRDKAAGTAPMASGGSARGLWIGGVAVLLLAAGGGAWWWQGRAAPAVATVATAAPALAPGAASTPMPMPGPSTAPTAPRTPLESLQALSIGAAPGFMVTAAAQKPEVAIGRDKLGFTLRSNREGYAYVYLLSSGGELFLMFPNLLDKYNKVAANATMTLPHASWPMNSGGPAGVNEFVVLVSEHERDFGATGVRTDGVFPQFQLPVLAALEAARRGPATPLLGAPVCPGATGCGDVYGVGRFSITEK